MINGECCYWCGEDAVSREHVPPKCLFPESKDVQLLRNKDFRLDLMTVPSCDKHNLNKSGEDEYLMACLAPKVGNNGIAYLHTKTKVARARARKKHMYPVLSNHEVVISNTKYPVEIIEVDQFKLKNSFEAIGRALYYLDKSNIFSGNCRILSNIFNYEKKDYDFIQKAMAISETERKQWKTEIKGKNPEVFIYQFGSIDVLGNQLLIMTFYQSINVYVAFDPGIFSFKFTSE